MLSSPLTEMSVASSLYDLGTVMFESVISQSGGISEVAASLEHV